MKQQSASNGMQSLLKHAILVFSIGAAMMVAPLQAISAIKAKPQETAAMPAEIGQPVMATIGKSTLVRLPGPIKRMSVGNPAIAEVTLINPREIYLLGKTVGATNIILWGTSGHTTIIDVSVGMDSASLNAKLHRMMPGEKNIKVDAAADSVVLTGEVSDAAKVAQATSLAEAYLGGAGGPGGGNRKVVNLLQVSAPQQVMLEVKVAEVRKSLLDKLGMRFLGTRTNGAWTYSLVSNFLFNSAGSTQNLGALTAPPNPNLSGGIGADRLDGTRNSLRVEAEKDDGAVKILAEPNIMAISGQEGSFLSGGKIFIPVPQASGGGGTSVITLQEQDFGVGLRFVPTVLADGRINLRVTPEVSEVSSTGTTVSASGSTSVLPTITTRRASTTIELRDGQSFAIGGLINNTVTEAINRYPVLGEIPILGALFRSSSFQKNQSELLFVVTPRLVKPLPPDYRLPTDNFIEPTRSEFLLGGQLEGKPKEQPKATEGTAKMPVKEEPAPQAGKPSGFEMK